MYNYNFESEKIILEVVDNLISISDATIRMNILITDDNLLLFKNIKANTIFSGRGIYEMPEYELLVKIKLDDINYKIDEENTIIKLGEKEIILYNFDLSKVKNQ